jgi:hypothetical protein
MLKRSLMVRKILGLLGVSFLLVLAGCATSNYQQNMKSPQIDRISEAELARIMPVPVAALSLDEVVKLSQAGNSADQIIEKIKTSNSLYDLTPSQTIALSQQGVDPKVLDHMHTSRELALRNSIADEINKREKEKRDALEKLKRQQLLQQRFYDPFCRSYYGFYPYGYGAYGSRFGSHFGLGAGYPRPWGCW